MQNYENNPLQALKLLSENASKYFDDLFAKHQNHMACAAGCSKCCEVDLTVMEAEAAAIADWFFSLPAEEATQWASVWKQARRQAQTGKRCHFLIDNKCTVYDVRPIICRTQGAPLRFKMQENEMGVDACPLNFVEENTFPDQKEWLDLDRLNTLLTIANQSFQKSSSERSLKALVNKDGRVSLTSLQTHFIKTSLGV